jgi:L-fuconolactonase
MSPEAPPPYAPPPEPVEGPRIDAHLHLWDLTTGEYGWNTPALGPAHANFGPADALTALRSAGVDAAVLVQAADTAGDTERMLAVAGRHPWVVGVVGWLPLDDPERSAELLDRWSEQPTFCGVRQLLHDHPDPDLLDAPPVRRTLRRLAARGVPLDVPDAWPRLWPALSRLVADLPGLTVILDHLGKPPLGSVAGSPGPELDAWRRDVAALAAAPSVVAKLSGLGSCLAPGTPVTSAALAPLVDVGLDAFGPTRLLRGGDWPVSLVGAGYAEVAAAVDGTLASLSRDERADLERRTAERVYGLRLS